MGINHTGMCDICGKKKATDTHHLIYSTSNRVLSDADNLTLEICRDCHNEIHKGKGGVAGHLSKMLGQALWERDYFSRKASELMTLPLEADVRDLFIKRYGMNRL